MNPRHDGRQPAKELFTPEVWSRIAKDLRLSKVQRRLAALLFDGFLEKQVSCKLGIAEATVRAHVRRLYEKLSVHSRAEFSKKIVSAYLHIANGDTRIPP